MQYFVTADTSMCGVCSSPDCPTEYRSVIRSETLDQIEGIVVPWLNGQRELNSSH